jgi:hypothetical protein
MKNFTFDQQDQFGKKIESGSRFPGPFLAHLNRGNEKKINKLDTVKLGASLSCYEAEFFPPALATVWETAKQQTYIRRKIILIESNAKCCHLENLL